MRFHAGAALGVTSVSPQSKGNAPLRPASGRQQQPCRMGLGVGDGRAGRNGLVAC